MSTFICAYLFLTTVVVLFVKGASKASAFED